MTVTEFLQTRVPFLEGLSEDQARSLAEVAEQTQYNNGQTVLFRGTTVDGLYVIASGKVSVWVKPEKAKALSQVAELGVGDVFGETSIIELGTAGATIKASEDATLIFCIHQDAFRGVLEANEQFRARASALIESRKKKNAELNPRRTAEIPAPVEPVPASSAAPAPKSDAEQAVDALSAVFTPSAVPA